MEWISVKDRQPEKTGRYIVTDGKNVDIVGFYGVYNKGFNWNCYPYKSLEVTHWMELPKLPEIKE